MEQVAKASVTRSKQGQYRKLVPRSARTWLEKPEWTIEEASFLLKGIEPPAQPPNRDHGGQFGPAFETIQKLDHLERIGLARFPAAPADVAALAIRWELGLPRLLRYPGDRLTTTVYPLGLATTWLSIATLEGMHEAAHTQWSAGLLTPADAIDLLADAEGIPAGMLAKMFERAVQAGTLIVRDPVTQEPFDKSRHFNPFGSLVRVDDVNRALETLGVLYRLSIGTQRRISGEQRPVAKPDAHKEHILRAIDEVGLDPSALPAGRLEGRNATAKTLIRRAIGGTMSIATFNKRWQDLRNEQRIRDAR